VLLSLADNIPQGDVEAMIQQRQSAAFKNVPELMSGGINLWAAKIKPFWLVTVSDAFVIRVEARFARARWAENMLVTRQGNKFQVLSRRKVAGL